MTSRVKVPSTLRADHAANTRLRILDAAWSEFVEQSYAGARIDAIAARAGVAVPTVYKVFTNKATLLVGAINRAMTDDEGDTQVDDQEWWIEQLDEPDPVRQLQLIARNARRIYERSAPLLEVLRAAAPMDEVLTDTWEVIATRRLERSRRTAKSIMTKTTHTRMKREDTALTLWSLTAPELFTTYLAGGRTPEHYERWLSDLLLRAILEAPASTE
jgi:AcrR family transcriptional regulator